MNLYLQFGHGMMAHSKHLIEKWGGGTVILSPRDLQLAQMTTLSEALLRLNGRVIVDPQFYLPHSDHKRLTSHSFWPKSYDTASFSQGQLQAMLSALDTDYNSALNTEIFILPGIQGTGINEDWFSYHDSIYKVAVGMNIRKPIYLTVSLSSGSLNSEDQLHDLLEYMEAWPELTGYYLVCEHPDHTYLVENPTWLLNLMDLCAGIKHLSKRLIVGYCSHQMLILALAKVDAICSGTWLNVRSFDGDKFMEGEDTPSRRTTWYFCPQALSEFQIPFLDIAKRMGKLGRMKTDPSFGSPYADVLFGEAQPSVVNFSEGDAFRHYLQCLKIQVEQSVKPTYKETQAGIQIQIDAAAGVLTDLQQSGIRAGNRDFGNVAEFNLAALDAFHQVRGLLQSQEWNSL
jgi:hypothetical protein